MYPIAFVLILTGLVVYFVMDGEFGDQAKPWLGRSQEEGVDGVGTARRRLERPNVVV
jgi:solute carrier family 35, member F1/2